MKKKSVSDVDLLANDCKIDLGKKIEGRRSRKAKKEENYECAK